jgi:hypothetical protein
MSLFFEYTCDTCATPFCERILIMNMALGFEEEQYCLKCLTQQENQPSEKLFFDWIKDYILARDCFLSPWQKFNPSPCPRIADQTGFCSPTEWQEVTANA